MRTPALSGLMALVFATQTLAAERISLTSAPAGIAALIEKNRDKPGVNEGCLLFNSFNPDQKLITIHRLDEAHQLLLADCERTMKFNVQRAFIIRNGDFGNANRARLPVPKSAHPGGMTSDSMDMRFDEKTKQLRSSAWEGGNCWSQRVWQWQGKKFIRISFKRNCAGG